MPFALSQQKIVAFIATQNLDAARTFYRDTLGLPLVDDSPWALIFDAHGIMLRVTPVKEKANAPYTVLGWETADIVEAVTALTKAGVKFERYQGYEQDELGIWTVPGGGAKVAWFLDPDGNVL